MEKTELVKNEKEEKDKEQKDEINFKKIGLKSGIEIHQQLDTHKLYCKCPSILRQDAPDFTIERKLHAVAGESGEIDKAASYEASQEKGFIYEGYKDTTCLVELDEEPPHLINQEALEIALHISLLLNCEIIPIAQIMRKTVIDGSNTSGFQRTVLIAKNGFIETSSGKVGIWYVYLEEDAARTSGNKDNKKIYRLDRLGIPLVEIVTAPDIKTPEQAKEVALHIGEILRSCKVKRGLGTIRQDINISIKKHPRAEIKGFQDPKIFIKVVENEVKRQLENLNSNSRKKEKLHAEVRGANPDATTKFLRPLPGTARMYPETDLPLLRISKQMINKAKKTLPKLKAEFREDLRKIGLNDEMSKLLLSESKLEDFESLLQIYNKPNFIVKAMILYPKEIASHEKIENIENILTIDIIELITQSLAKKQISEEQVKEIMKKIAKGSSFEQAVIPEQVSEQKTQNLEQEIINLIKEKPNLSIGAYMGLLMQKFKGKISGKELSDLLKKHVKS